QFAEVAAEGTQLLFQAGAVDGDLTGVVHQAVEQVGADTHLLLRRADAGALFLLAQVLDRRGQRREADGRRGRTLYGRGRRSGRRRLLGGGLGRRGSRRGRGGDGIQRLALGQGVDLRDQVRRQADRAALADAGDHAVQAVEGVLEHADAGRIELAPAFGHRLQQRLHGVAQLADGEDAGHAGAALERVQIALQGDDALGVIRVVAQAGDQAVGMVEQVGGLFQEDIEQVLVDVAGIQRLVRILAVQAGEGRDRLGLFGFFGSSRLGSASLVSGRIRHGGIGGRAVDSGGASYGRFRGGIVRRSRFGSSSFGSSSFRSSSVGSGSFGSGSFGSGSFGSGSFGSGSFGSSRFG